MSASDRWHREFSLEELGYRLHAVPMFLVLIPYVVGVIIADNYTLPWVAVLAAMAVCMLVAWLLRSRRVAWLYCCCAFLLLGYVAALMRTPQSSLLYDTAVEMEVSIDSEVVSRGDYSVADGTIRRWRDAETWHEADDDVHLWLRCDTLHYGDVVTACSSLRWNISRHEGYDRLLHHRGKVGAVSLAGYNILSVSHHEPRSLHGRAYGKLRTMLRDSCAHATVQAMVTGSRAMMTAELREAYSRTGLSHILAVSGLHLGIVMMVIMMLFTPLVLLRHGHRMVTVITIVGVWLFAVVSGLSPSVVRAAVMLTVLSLSMLGAGHYNSLNALAATAFAMLVYRPSYLYDISFQLSVVAVAGIVVWGVPLIHRLSIRDGALRWLVVTIIIGFVATLWTLPIVSYTFGNLPLVGIVATPFIMLTAYIIIPCGLLALLSPNVLAMPFVVIAELAAEVQNGVVLWFAQRPLAAVEYSLTWGGVVGCYLLYVIITLTIWSVKRKKVVTLFEYDEYRRLDDIKE